jgi:hypothetical protein
MSITAADTLAERCDRSDMPCKFVSQIRQLKEIGYWVLGLFRIWAISRLFGLSYRSDYIYLQQISITAALISLIIKSMQEEYVS